MIFKLLRRESPAVITPPPTDQPTHDDAAVAVDVASESEEDAQTEVVSREEADLTPPAIVGEVAPAMKARRVAGHSLDFATTADIEPSLSPIGQERAMAALSFALEVPGPGYNIVLSCAEGSDGFRAHGPIIREAVLQHYARALPPPDTLYARDPNSPGRMMPLLLPAGRGRAFTGALSDALAEAALILAIAFASEDYQMERRAVEDRLRARTEDAIAGLSDRAAAQNIALLRTPTGYVLAPMHDGEVVKRETFAGLPDSYRDDVTARIETLRSELAEIASERSSVEAEFAGAALALDVRQARAAIDAVLTPVRNAFSDATAAVAYIDAVSARVSSEVARLRAKSGSVGDEQPRVVEPIGRLLTAFAPSVLVASDGSTVGAPVIESSAPTREGLSGVLVPHDESAGGGAAISPGLLHLANGGCLILDASALADEPAACRLLTQALAMGSVPVLKGGDDSVSAASAVIAPLNVKVVLIGDVEAVARLRQSQSGLLRHFKIESPLDNEIARSEEIEAIYAQRVAFVAAAVGARPFTRDAVGQVIEAMSASTLEPDAISLDVDRLADLVREADIWAQRAGAAEVDADHIARVLDNRIGHSGDHWRPVRRGEGRS